MSYKANQEVLAISGTGNLTVSTVTVTASSPTNAITSTTGVVRVSGEIVASGDITAFSDIALKDDVKQIENPLTLVEALRGVTYIKDGKKSIGLIAQNVKDVVPSAVHDNGDYLSVAYGNLVGVLIEAIKDLKKEVDYLKENKNGS